jgi:hypothetical protein
MEQKAHILRDDPATWPDVYVIEEQINQPEVLDCFTDRLAGAVIELVAGVLPRLTQPIVEALLVGWPPASPSLPRSWNAPADHGCRQGPGRTRDRRVPCYSAAGTRFRPFANRGCDRSVLPLPASRTGRE